LSLKFDRVIGEPASPGPGISQVDGERAAGNAQNAPASHNPGSDCNAVFEKESRRCVECDAKGKAADGTHDERDKCAVLERKHASARMDRRN
jgi:hypothetical protein